MSCRFTDHTKYEWTLHLTYGSTTDVKRETGVNLAMASQNRDWVDLLFGDDPGKIISVLWILCEAQAKTIPLTPEEFAHRFDGPTLEAAGAALAFAIADFFPRSKIAEAIKKRLATMLEQADQAAVKKIEEVMPTGSSSASNSPESVASIPPG